MHNKDLSLNVIYKDQNVRSEVKLRISNTNISEFTIGLGLWLTYEQLMK
jgi:hypothetical protein